MSKPLSDVEIKVRGMVFDRWKTVRITRSLETVTGSWELTAAGFTPFATINAGDAVQVFIQDQPVSTGYIDEQSWTCEAGSNSVSLSGRDKTADLVDCSVVGARQLNGLTLKGLAQQLCKPFRVAVAGADGGALPAFTLQPGETVFSALERAARMKGYLLHSNALGELVIARPATQDTATVLTLGLDIKTIVTSVNMRDRFSQYMVQSQALGATVTHQTHAERDAGVPRYRPLVLSAQEGDDPITRARWTRQVRQARGTRVNVTVVGWQNGSKLWEPNTLVQVNTPLWAQTLLVASVTFIRDENGTRTEMECVRPGAYNPEPEPRSKKDVLK